MKTVLVIPAYNEGGTLGGLVQAVLRLEPRSIDEVIVVDDGSSDDCLAEVTPDPASTSYDTHEMKARREH